MTRLLSEKGAGAKTPAPLAFTLVSQALMQLVPTYMLTHSLLAQPLRQRRGYGVLGSSSRFKRHRGRPARRLALSALTL